jgi:hypothetical protein
MAPTVAAMGRLTIIALGNKVDTTLLSNLTNNIVTWDMTTSAPNNWENIFQTAYGCAGGPATNPTQPPVTRGPQTQRTPGNTPATPPPAQGTTKKASTAAPGSTRRYTGTTQAARPTAEPYIPCGNEIVIAFDNSKGLTATQFQTEQQFLKSRVFAEGNFNHFDRLAFGYYNSQPQITSVGVLSTRQEVDNAIDGAYLSTKPASLRLLFQLLASYQSPVGPLGQMSVIIFISNTNQADVQAATGSVPGLPSGTRITFVILGTAIQPSLLAPISNNTIQWSNLNNPQPDNWRDLFWTAYNCGSPPPTTST